MAKKKINYVKIKRYTVTCPYCKTNQESDKLNDIKGICCGKKLTINDNYKILSRSKEELKKWQ